MLTRILVELLVVVVCVSDVTSDLSPPHLNEALPDEGTKDAFLSETPHLRRRATTVLFDDFSSGQINSKYWKYTVNAGWFEGSRHAEMYTPEHTNCYVRNGILYIRPTLTVDTFGSNFLWNGHLDSRAQWGSCDNGYCWANGWNRTHPPTPIRAVQSCMLRSIPTIQYGRVEIVAKLAKGDWFWNALWMMPAEPPVYGDWPQSGEIDLMESAGNRHFTEGNGKSRGIDRMGSSIHYGNEKGSAHDVHVHDFYQLVNSTFGDGFHKYWVDWTQQHIVVGVDSHTVLTVKTPPEGFYRHSHLNGTNPWANRGPNAPFDQPFFLIMNIHVGGGPFDVPGWHNHPYPLPWDRKADFLTQMKQFWKNSHLWHPTWQGESAAMQIKSVKMLQY